MTVMYKILRTSLIGKHSTFWKRTPRRSVWDTFDICPSIDMTVILEIPVIIELIVKHGFIPNSMIIYLMVLNLHPFQFWHIRSLCEIEINRWILSLSTKMFRLLNHSLEVLRFLRYKSYITYSFHSSHESYALKFTIVYINMNHTHWSTLWINVHHTQWSSKLEQLSLSRLFILF